MADTKISALPAVTTPAGTDEYATNQGGVSKKTTNAVLFTNPVHGGYDDFTVIADPANPGASTGRLYADGYVSRVVPSWKGPSGQDIPMQAALWGSHIFCASPATGTTTPNYIGGNLTSAGTVSHPTPTGTSLATAMRRIRWANVATTTNQVLGIHGGSADMASFWRGNITAGGGWFFYCRFSTALWAANTVRLFVGLRSGTTAVVASDTLAGSLCGFWHDTTVGGTTINFTTRDGTTANSTAITVPTLGADVGFDAYIYCAPNGGTIFYRLDRLDTLATIVDSSTTTNIPAATTFMAPEAAMSNGTANTTVTTVAFALNKLYIESDF